MTPKQNEPTDLVVSVLEHYRQELFAAGLGHDEVKKALTLAKLQSEAVTMLREHARYPDSTSFGARLTKLLRAIDEAQK